MSKPMKQVCPGCGDLKQRREMNEVRTEYRNLSTQARFKTRATGRVLCDSCVRVELGRVPDNQASLL